jgi:hypothetical protein
MDLYYKHSGRFTTFGVLAGLFAGIAASLPLAWLYSYGIIQMPFIKLRALSTIVFGLAVGAAAGFGLVWGKVRNNWITALTGFLTSASALYLSWVFWILQLSVVGKYAVKDFDLLFQPMTVWEIMQRVRDIGTWGSSGSESTHGTELTVIWSIEALTVLGIGTAAAIGILRKRPFCENCDCWCNRSKKLVFFPSVFGQDLKQRLESKDLSFVGKLVPSSEKFAHIRFDLFSCSTCNMLNTISVTQVLVQPAKSKWNKAKVERKELLTFLMLGPEEAALLRRVAMGVSSAPAAAASSAAAAK